MTATYALQRDWRGETLRKEEVAPARSIGRRPVRRRHAYRRRGAVLSSFWPGRKLECFYKCCSIKKGARKRYHRGHRFEEVLQRVLGNGGCGRGMGGCYPWQPCRWTHWPCSPALHTHPSSHLHNSGRNMNFCLKQSLPGFAQTSSSSELCRGRSFGRRLSPPIPWVAGRTR